MSDSSSDYPVKRPWTSLVTTLVVQSQNAFNDNFLKTLLINLAGIVAVGTVIGDDAARIFSAFIPALFLMFSPLAGWLSDKFSKRSVMFWCVLIQIAILGLTITGLFLQSIYLAMFCLVALSVQSTIFSPAKQGILKELVGSKKLTVANAMLQMFTMLSIIAGIGIAGWWFGSIQKEAVDVWNITNTEKPPVSLAWRSALLPVLGISIAALLPLLMNFFLDKTPAQSPNAKFELPILWRHFGYLKEVFLSKELAKTASGITFYWLLASFMGVVIFDIGKALHPGDGITSGAAAKESSIIWLIMGAGLTIGSILVALLCSKGNKLKLIPLGGLGMTLAVVVSGFLSINQLGGILPETALPPKLINLPLYLSMGGIGFFGAFFLAPLSTNLQDLAPNEKRGRIIGAVAVLTSSAGLIAIAISFILTKLDLKPATQILCFTLPTLAITWYVSSLSKTQRTDLP